MNSNRLQQIYHIITISHYRIKGLSFMIASNMHGQNVELCDGFKTQVI